MIGESIYQKVCERFIPALETIIKADGTYLSDKDLRNGHRKVMQWMVRGGARRRDPGAGPQGSGGGREGGVGKIFASWEGMTNKINTQRLKKYFLFRVTCS